MPAGWLAGWLPECLLADWLNKIINFLKSIWFWVIPDRDNLTVSCIFSHFFHFYHLDLNEKYDKYDKNEKIHDTVDFFASWAGVEPDLLNKIHIIVVCAIGRSLNFYRDARRGSACADLPARIRPRGSARVNPPACKKCGSALGGSARTDPPAI